MGQTQQVFIETYEQSLSADCDLDLSASNMVLALNTLSSYRNNFEITPFSEQTNELDMKMFSL